MNEYNQITIKDKNTKSSFGLFFGFENQSFIGNNIILDYSNGNEVYVYFENIKQPASYRTENPTSVSLKVGVKFSLK